MDPMAMEKVLKINKETLDGDQSFETYGLDSITAMQLATLLEKKLKHSIEPSWFIKYNSVNRLSEKLTNDFSLSS